MSRFIYYLDAVFSSNNTEDIITYSINVSTTNVISDVSKTIQENINKSENTNNILNLKGSSTIYAYPLTYYLKSLPQHGTLYISYNDDEKEKIP